MTEKQFQKRYIKKNNKVYDTWKEMPITDELNSDSLLNVISHLNGLGNIIDSQIEQGRYCFGKYYELKEENELLQKTLDDTVELLNKKIMDCPVYRDLVKTNQQQKETIKKLKKKKNKNNKIYIQSQSIKPEFGGNINLGDDIND